MVTMNGRLRRMIATTIPALDAGAAVDALQPDFAMLGDGTMLSTPFGIRGREVHGFEWHGNRDAVGSDLGRAAIADGWVARWKGVTR